MSSEYGNPVLMLPECANSIVMPSVYGNFMSVASDYENSGVILPDFGNSLLLLPECENTIVSPCLYQTFHAPNLGDEDFDIPPLTSPSSSMTTIAPTYTGSMSYANMDINPQFPPLDMDNNIPHISDEVFQTEVVQLDAPFMTTSSDLRQEPSSSGQLVSIQNAAVTAKPIYTSPSKSQPKPSPASTSSVSSSESDEGATLHQKLKRSMALGMVEKIKKKPKSPKKKKMTPEPQKPVSAYALFFRDTQAAIKSENPSASFGEVSKIVASMWDSLDDEHKEVYKKKTEMAKKEYLKQLAAYRANMVCKGLLGDPSVESTTKTAITKTTVESPQRESSMLIPTPSLIEERKMRCIRNGCTNFAVDCPDWDREYCSNECVVTHCKDVFMAWVASRQPAVLS